MEKVYVVYRTRSEQYICSLPDRREVIMLGIFSSEDKAIDAICDLIECDRGSVEELCSDGKIARTFKHDRDKIREGERYRSWDRIRQSVTDFDLTVHYHYEAHYVM